MRRKPTDSLMTLDEVGAELKITRERVRQIEREALRKLRLILQKRGITCADDLLPFDHLQPDEFHANDPD